MHSVMVIGGGLVLLLVALFLGRTIGGAGAASIALAVKVFLPVWLCVSWFNMWVGVSRGYTVMQEIPFLFLVFGVPALVAAFVWWKFGSA